MKKIISTSLLAVSLLSANAFADEKNYATLGYGQLSYSEPSLDISGISSLNLALGHMFTQNWGIEGRLSLGLSSGSKNITVNSTPVTVDVKLDNSIALLGVANYPVSQSFNVFAKAGLASVTLSGTVTNRNTGQSADLPSNSGTGFTFMAGANYAVSQGLFVEFEAGSYYNRNDVSVTGFELGIKKTF